MEENIVLQYIESGIKIISVNIKKMIQLKAILAFLKLNKWILYLVIVAAIFGSGLYFGIKAYKSEMKRMENNYLAAIEQLRGDSKEQQRVYELKLSEVKNQFPEIKETLKSMDIKLKNVVSVENVNTITQTNVNTVLRDTLIRDTIHAQTASYKDLWTDFKLIKIQDSILVKMATKDSLVCVLNRVPRTFKEWIKGDPKQVKNTIKNFNPNSTIIYNRLIQIKK